MAVRETDQQDRIVRQGVAAWVRLKKDKNWHDWLAVGDALLIGRGLAMYQAGTNRPSGKGYSQEFGRWLSKNKLDDMDKSDRAKLFKVMDNLAAIEQWRATLTLTERLKLNHPVTVLRNYERATEIPEISQHALAADDDEEIPDFTRDNGLTLEQAVLRALFLAEESDAEAMDHGRKTTLLGYIKRLADWARQHLPGDAANSTLDPETASLLAKKIENPLQAAPEGEGDEREPDEEAGDTSAGI
jgi:hypothetical protein